MKKNIFLLIGAILLLSIPSQGQQLVQYSLNMLNPLAYNPAQAGLSGSIVANVGVRKQWVGITGSPLSQNLNVSLPWDYTSSGIGLILDNETLGAERNMSLALSYAYHLQIGKTHKVSIGAAVGILQKELDGAKLRAPEGLYEGATFSHNDTEIPEVSVSDLSPQIHAGIFYQSKKTNAGVAISNINRPVITYQFDDVTNIEYAPTLFANASHRFDLTEVWSLTPSAFLKTDRIETQLEGAVTVSYDDFISLGAGYRGYNANTQDAILLILSIGINENLRLSYAYDYTLSPLNQVSSGSHEVLITYDLRKKIGGGVPPPIIYNPRLP